MELVLLSVFAVVLLIAVLTANAILPALMFGYVLFFGYGLYKKCSVKRLLLQSLNGIKSVKNILITFVLIGMLTAMWRAGGTIPMIVYYAAKICSPTMIVLSSFLMCCLVSSLTGTSLGTAATVGVICMTMSESMGVPAALTGGAILAGAYFGDRCSPMSTSALLVSELTKTSIFRNITNMIRTSLVPFAMTCAAYAAAGFLCRGGAGSSDVQEIFAQNFRMRPPVLLPALVIVVLSLFKVNVKKTMAVSIVFGVIAAAFIQGAAPGTLLHMAVYGYRAESPELAALLNGGGILSMTRVFAIVCLSSCYAGIFEETGFLNPVKEKISLLGDKIAPFGAILVTSVVTGVVACNQTLTIMLTHQLCSRLEPDPEQMAVNLENTAVLIPAMIPWCIACAVPLATVGAPLTAIPAACYLWILPAWNYAFGKRVNP